MLLLLVLLVGGRFEPPDAAGFAASRCAVAFSARARFAACQCISGRAVQPLRGVLDLLEARVGRLPFANGCSAVAARPKPWHGPTAWQAPPEQVS